MSYLNVPRLHFSGRFQADPSTVNNNDSNYDPTVQLSNEPPDSTLSIDNTSVYWNPNGTHNWKFVDCTVRGAADDNGPFNSANNTNNDPIIGAQVISAGRYPAKIVDLDPDNQAVSQIFGLQLQVSIPNPAHPAAPLASFTATLPPTAFGDLWNRAANVPPNSIGSPTMSAVFQAVLTNVTWTNPSPTVSPLLTALQAASSPSNTLSIRFVVDSHQVDSTQSNFTFGRIVGTIGPALTGEAPRSTPRRLAPLVTSLPAGTPPIFTSYGPAGAAWDARRKVLTLDLGDCVPTVWSAPPTNGGPSIPDAGWPFAPGATYQLTIPGPGAGPTPYYVGIKSGRPIHPGLGAPSVLGTIAFTMSTYLDYAGIVEIPVQPALASSLLSQPLSLTDVTNSALPVPAAKEDLLGRYVDVDVPFFRLNPGDTGAVTLWATRYGQPWNGANLDVALLPAGHASNGPTVAPFLWQNSSPQGALGLSTASNPVPASSATVTTASNGTGVLTLTASDPGKPRMYPDGQAGPDGQVYWITGSWASFGQIFLYSGAPINVLVFSSHTMPAAPTWTNDVGPILSNYARMYPYMMSIIDLGNYPTVKQNASAIQKVLNLPPENPHHMPIVRDLSGDKLAMINQWFANGMPQ